MVGGMFGSYNVALAWISSTFARPRAKRAAAYATINSLGNSMPSAPASPHHHQHAEGSKLTTFPTVAQIWSPYLYDKKYSPQYKVCILLTRSRYFRQEICLTLCPDRFRHKHRHGSHCSLHLFRFAFPSGPREQGDGETRGRGHDRGGTGSCQKANPVCALDSPALMGRTGR